MPGPVPPPDDVPVLVGVLQVAPFEGVDLPLEVGEGVRDLRPPPHQLGQLLPRVYVGDALLSGHCDVSEYRRVSIRQNKLYYY